MKAGVFPVLPEFQYTLVAVTDTFYSMDYRRADEQTRQKLYLDIERKLQKMLRFYKKKVKNRSGWNFWRGMVN